VSCLVFWLDLMSTVFRVTHCRDDFFSLPFWGGVFFSHGVVLPWLGLALRGSSYRTGSGWSLPFRVGLASSQWSGCHVLSFDLTPAVFRVTRGKMTVLDLFGVLVRTDISSDRRMLVDTLHPRTMPNHQIRSPLVGSRHLPTWLI